MAQLFWSTFDRPFAQSSGEVPTRKVSLAKPWPKQWIQEQHVATQIKVSLKECKVNFGSTKQYTSSRYSRLVVSFCNISVRPFRVQGAPSAQLQNPAQCWAHAASVTKSKWVLRFRFLVFESRVSKLSSLKHFPHSATGNNTTCHLRRHVPLADPF